MGFGGWAPARAPSLPVVVPAKLVLGLDFPRREGPAWFCTVLFISNWFPWWIDSRRSTLCTQLLAEHASMDRQNETQQYRKVNSIFIWRKKKRKRKNHHVDIVNQLLFLLLFIDHLQVRNSRQTCMSKELKIEKLPRVKYFCEKQPTLMQVLNVQPTMTTTSFH